MAYNYQIAQLDTGQIWNVEASSPRVALSNLMATIEPALIVRVGTEVLVHWAIKNTGKVRRFHRVTTKPFDMPRIDRWGGFVVSDWVEAEHARVLPGEPAPEGDGWVEAGRDKARQMVEKVAREQLALYQALEATS